MKTLPADLMTATAKSKSKTRHNVYIKVLSVALFLIVVLFQSQLLFNIYFKQLQQLYLCP